MSPYLATLVSPQRTRTRRRRPMRTAQLLKVKPRARRRRPRPTPNYTRGVELAGATRYLGGYDDGLGFSLKPPKFIRKAAKFVKKNVTLKRALIAGAVVGAAFIPGVGPAALAAAKAAGRGVASVFRGTVGRVEHGIVGLFKKKAATYGPFPDQGQGTPSDQGTPSGGTTPSGTSSGGATSSGGGGGGGAQYGPTPDQSGGGSSGGGGAQYGPPAPSDGGDDGSSDDGSEPVPMPEATATTDDGTTPPAQAGALPILLGIGALALLAKRR